MRELFACVTGVEQTPGGIAASNRNVLGGLADVAAARGVPLRVVSYLERDNARPSVLHDAAEFRGARGDRVRLLRLVVPRFGRDTVAVFDHVGLAAAALPWARLCRMRVVIFVHGSEASWRLKRVAVWAYRSAALCLTNSDYTRRNLERSVPGVQAQTCELGLPAGHEVDLGGHRADGALVLEAVDGVARPIGDRAFLLVARMDPTERRKGHSEALAVLAEVAEHHPEVQVVMAGGGAGLPEIRDAAAGLGVGSRVFLPGHVPEKALADLYARCFAFVLPSRQEGFGLAYLEAMARGKACIAHRGQGCEAFVLDGLTGVLVDLAKGTDSLRDAMLRLLADPEASRSLGAEGRRLVEAKYTASHHRARVRDAIEGLLG